MGHQLICMAAVTSSENTLCKAYWLPNCSHKINLRRDLFCKRFCCSMKTLLSLTFLSFVIDKATINTHKQLLSVADLWEGPAPPPSLIFRPNCDLKGRKKFF